MKALILNALGRGMPEYGIFEILVCELQKYAIVIDTLHLQEVEIQPCRHCYQCWTKTPGLCVIDDMGREIAKGMLQTEMTIIVSKTICGEIQQIVKHAFGRTIPNFSAPKIRNQYFDLVAIGIAEQDDAMFEEQYQENVHRLGIDFHCLNTTAGIVTIEEGQQLQKQKVETFIAKAGSVAALSIR